MKGRRGSGVAVKKGEWDRNRVELKGRRGIRGRKGVELRAEKGVGVGGNGIEGMEREWS